MQTLRGKRHLASAQVSQYSRNHLIKHELKPRQIPLDFSLAHIEAEITQHTVNTSTQQTLQSTV